MSKTFSLAVLSLVLLATAIGCGSSQVFVRGGDDPAQPIDLNKDKMLILHCDVYGFSGDATTYTAALCAGVISKFGTCGLDLTPLKPVFEGAGLGNMAYKLANGVYHCIDFHQSYSLNDSCGKGIEEVPVGIAKLVGLVSEKMKLDFKPRFIFALAVISEGAGMVPGTAKYRVIACIYDAEKSLIHSATYYTATTAEDALVAQMSQIPGEAFDMIMEKAAPAGCTAAPAEGEGEGKAEGEGKTEGEGDAK